MDNDVFDLNIKIHYSLGGHIWGKYSKENEKWIKDNINNIFKAIRHNINYYRFENGYLCHIYNATIITTYEDSYICTK